MQLEEFVVSLADFDQLTPKEKIQVFAWYLHTYENKDSFDNGHMRTCFRRVHLAPPDVSIYLPRMAERSPPDLIRVRGGYKLEGALRRSLDAKLGCETTVVTKLLSDLPTKIPNLAERSFLAEALNCYKVGAYRAAILMAWNLALDHLILWILADPIRLASFNQAIKSKYPKRTVSKREDFEELSEYDIVEFCRAAKLTSKNVSDILREKLKRRNAAAHPSTVTVTRAQADDVITDLVNNVVLSLH
jgi:hypothetical protein